MCHILTVLPSYKTKSLNYALRVKALLVRPTGFEPAALRVGVLRSIRMSYERIGVIIHSRIKNTTYCSLCIENSPLRCPILPHVMCKVLLFFRPAFAYTVPHNV